MLTTSPLLVVQTYYVEGRRSSAPPHFEIHLAPRAQAPPPWFRLPHRCHACTVLVTRDPALYQDALDAEGSQQFFLATHHRQGGYEVLDTLEATR